MSEIKIDLKNKSFKFLVDRELKENVEAILNKIGLNPSVAVNLFFKQVTVENGLPMILTSRSAEAENKIVTNDRIEKLGKIILDYISDSPDKKYKFDQEMRELADARLSGMGDLHQLGEKAHVYIAKMQKDDNEFLGNLRDFYQRYDEKMNYPSSQVNFQGELAKYIESRQWFVRRVEAQIYRIIIKYSEEKKEDSLPIPLEDYFAKLDVLSTLEYEKFKKMLNDKETELEAGKEKIQVLVDKKVKAEAEAILNALGIPINIAMTAFYKQIIEVKGLPFVPKLDAVEAQMIKKRAVQALKDQAEEAK